MAGNAEKQASGSMMADNSDMTASVHFTVKYDGPALADSQMNVRELGPALMGLGELIEAANREIFPDGTPVSVNVQGSFKSGSFLIDLIANQSLVAQVLDLLNSREATAAANLAGILGLLGIVGASGKGLISLIKFLRGRKPSEVRIIADEVVYTIIEGNEVEEFAVDFGTHKLYQSRVVRRSLAKVVKPLATPGIDVFAVGVDGATQQVVTKEEYEWFEKSAEGVDVVSDTTAHNVLLQIESAVFKDSNKWRFHDGNAAFYAELGDEEFVSRINSGVERFGKGDVLVVDLRRVQTVGDAGLKTEFIVERVSEHRDPLQTKLL